MRISDWSSDVGSSDLVGRGSPPGTAPSEWRSKPSGTGVATGAGREAAGRPGGEAAGIHPASANAPRNAAIRWLTAPTRPSCQSAGRMARADPSPLRGRGYGGLARSEEHTSELQSLMRISYAVFCLKKKKRPYIQPTT